MKKLLVIAILTLVSMSYVAAQNLSPVKDDNTDKWGFVNSKGEWAILPILDEYYSRYWDGIADKPVDFATVKYKGKWGCIDKAGNFVVKPVFMDASDAHKAGGSWQSNPDKYANVIKGLSPAQDDDTRKWGFLNNAGEWAILPVLDEYYSRFWDGTTEKPVDFATVKYKSKWGCIDKAGNFVVKPVFMDASDAHKAGTSWQSNPTREQADDSGSTMATSSKSVAVTVAPQSSSHSSPTTSASATSNNQSAPVLKILSPSGGSSYDTPQVVISFEVKTSGNIPYELQVSVDGEKQEAVTLKGVKRASEQVTITLPRKQDRACNVQLVAKDANGYSSEPVSVALNYVGDKPKPNLLVMAVGVNDYQQQDMKLKNAANDATDFVKTIKAKDSSLYGSVKVSSLLLNQDATFVNIRRALSQIVKEASQDDVVMLFFSGHGSVEENRKYYLPVNAEPDDLFSTAVNFEDIISTANRLKDKNCKVIIIMDACHSGALLGMKSTFSLDISAPGISMLTSSTGNQQSKELSGWRNGVFTKYLIDGLQGAAADEQGNVTIDNLGFYVRKMVSEKDLNQSPLYHNEQRNFILFQKAK